MLPLTPAIHDGGEPESRTLSGFIKPVTVFETVGNRLPLLSKLAEDGRIERPHPLRGVTVFKTDAHH
jgi:hypothetical protein